MSLTSPLPCFFSNFLLFSHIFANFAVENRENGQHLGNANEFDRSRFALVKENFSANEKKYISSNDAHVLGDGYLRYNRL